MKPSLPPLPLSGWRAAKETLHLYAQVLGKVRLALAPRRNHWWHVSLRVSPRGLSTAFVPYRGGGFEVEISLVGHEVEFRASDGSKAAMPLRDGLSVAAFYRWVFGQLGSHGIKARIRAEPYDLPFAKVPFPDDERHASYDPAAAERYAAILRWTAGVLEEFAGRYAGKTSPVHFFWHAFDLALTRFSGRRAPRDPEAGALEREAYSHEVASFGFWPGDDDVRAPAFYAYAAPVPRGLSKEPLLPRGAKWSPKVGTALLLYDDVRRSRDPRKALLSFYESAFEAARTRARWAAAVPRGVTAPAE